MRGIEAPIELAGQYDLEWTDYSDSGGTRGTVRTLVLEANGRPGERASTNHLPVVVSDEAAGGGGSAP